MSVSKISPLMRLVLLVLVLYGAIFEAYIFVPSNRRLITFRSPSWKTKSSVKTALSAADLISSFRTQFDKTMRICLENPGRIGTVATASVAFLASLNAIIPIVNPLKRLLYKIEMSTITKSTSNHYVNRPELESQVVKAETSVPLGCYWVIYGPKGVGKTELIDHVSIGNKGVVKVFVTSADSKDDIMSALSKKLLGTDSVRVDIPSFISAVEKSGFYPTIIFDVERGGSNDQILGIQAVRSLAKLLAHKCRCFIILSEANAVLEFGKDCDRERFIFVNELTLGEAKNLLLSLNHTMSEQEVEYVLQNVGACPALLINMMDYLKDGMNVTQFVEGTLRQARLELVSFPHQEILQALKEHPEGVSPKYFNNRKSEGVDLSNPHAVGLAMKASNAIVYRMELRLYQLMSTAHRTALESYKPIINP